MPARAIALATALGLVLLGAAPVASQSPASVSIDDDRAEISFEIGTLGLDVEISFDGVLGLDLENLGVSVETVDLLDATFLSRLPSTAVSVPAAFPILLTIAPPSTGALSFSDACTVELYTHDLTFTAGTPLRLFRAPDGGDFVDITSGMGTGSYRARGQVGDFSEFLILTDLRSSSTVIEDKFDRLEALLDDVDGLMPAATALDLADHLADARSSWEANDVPSAISTLDDFTDTVEDGAGADIPNVWRSSRDLRNAAGELLSAANTLLFSLRLAG